MSRSGEQPIGPADLGPLGLPGDPAADVGQFWRRILARALEPGGLDTWARVQPKMGGTTAVSLTARDGGEYLVVPVMLSDGIRRITDGDETVHIETRKQLDEALDTLRTDHLSPRSASEIVQVTLLGERKF